MKKILTLAILAAGAMTASAQTGAPDSPRTFADSISYYTGLTEGEYINARAAKMDSPEKAEAYRQANRRAVEYAFSPAAGDRDYAEALMRALQMRMVLDDMAAKGLDINTDLFLNSYLTAFDQPAKPMDEVAAEGRKVQQMITTANQRIRAIEEAKEKAQAEKNAADGAKYIADMKKADKKIKTTESGLSYKVVKAGKNSKKAPHPADSDKVKVHYTGRLIDGTVFDSSVERGEPATFGVDRVIPGFAEGLKMMTPGSKYTFYIPGSLGYGERGAGDKIGPNATLIFDVELFEINPEDSK